MFNLLWTTMSSWTINWIEKLNFKWKHLPIKKMVKIESNPGQDKNPGNDWLSMKSEDTNKKKRTLSINWWICHSNVNKND